MIWLPADNNGCPFGDHRRRQAGKNYIETREVDRYKLLSTSLINDLISYFGFIRDLAQHCGQVARTLDRVDL